MAQGLLWILIWKNWPNIRFSNRAGLALSYHNLRVEGSSPSSATIYFNKINILHRLENDFEAFFLLHTSYTLFYELPAKFFEPNVELSDIGKIKKSECGHYPAEQVQKDVFGELVTFF